VNWRILMCFGLLYGCTPSETAWFSEEAKTRGIDFVHHSGFDGRPMMPEMMGGGVALADLDGDADLDLYLVQSGRVDKALPAEFTANQLYLNRGDGYFHRVERSGADDRGYGMGVTSGDYDNDGDIDLYVTNLGANVLLQNDGTGQFTDVTQSAGVGDTSWSTAATFLDLDADGDLDLFVVNYLHWSKSIEQDCYGKAFFITYCGPTVYDVPAMDRLYRNNGDGTFTDITADAGMNVAFGNGLGTVGADFNGDGLLDIFVANDSLVNQLWVNQGNLQFTEECLLWSCAMDSNGLAKAGMGVASADVDDDGDSDLLVVNLVRQSDSFFRNEGTYFFDVTGAIGLGPVSMRYTRFGVTLADFDNDGRLDLYEVNGKVEMSEPAEGDGFAEPNTLLRGSIDADGVRFDEVKPQGGVSPTLTHTSRGLAVGDVDNDGGVDLVVTNRDAAPYLLMNKADRGNWVRFKVLNGSRDAHGATVSATVNKTRLSRDVQPSASYLAASDPRVHFGLGDASGVNNVTVRWPGGDEEVFGDFDPGTTHELRKGNGNPVSR
jgi:enediyne biosynthesis protein E4